MKNSRNVLLDPRPCQICHEPFRPRKQDFLKGGGKFCSRACLHKWQRGSGHPNWKGGTTVCSSGGYLVNTGKERIHRIVAENALGKPLPATAVVHHHDRNPLNNANSNLVICENQAYHRMLHARMRVFYAGGDPNTEGFCSSCRSVKPVSDFHKSTANSSGIQYTCKRCMSTNGQERKR